MSSSFSFTAEKYAELTCDKDREAFKTLMLALLEAEAKKVDAKKAEAKAKALVVKAEAEVLETEALEQKKKQEEFLLTYPEGYVYARDPRKVIEIKNEAFKACLFVRTFVENVEGEAITKVMFSIPKKKK